MFVKEKFVTKRLVDLYKGDVFCVNGRYYLKIDGSHIVSLETGLGCAFADETEVIKVSFDLQAKIPFSCVKPGETFRLGDDRIMIKVAGVSDRFNAVELVGAVTRHFSDSALVTVIGARLA